MSHQVDLSFHSYTRCDYGPTLAIGWLDLNQDYPKGKVPLDFIKRLNQVVLNYRDYYTRLFRGTHTNEIAVLPEYRSYYQSIFAELISDYPPGNGEFRIKYQKKYYACPVMILEYVVANGYLPPAEFIEAVIYGEFLTSEQEEHLQTNNIDRDAFNKYADASQSEEAKAIHAQADKALRAGDMQKGVAIVDEGIKKHPNHTGLIFYNIRLDTDSGYAQRALLNLEELIKVFPNSYQYYSLKAIALERTGNHSKADEAFRLVLAQARIDGGHNLVQILYYLAKFAESKAEFEAAIQYFAEANQIHPQDQEIAKLLKKNRLRVKLKFLPSFLLKMI